MKRLMFLFFALALCGAASAGEWHIETVDEEGEVGIYSSLVLDSYDFPHVVYANADSGTVEYAYWNGFWHFETVAEGVPFSLALDSCGYPHILSCKVEGGGYARFMKYSRWDGAEWLIKSWEDRIPNSMALDSDDNAHISYYTADCHGHGEPGWDYGSVMYTGTDGYKWWDEYVDMPSYWARDVGSLALDSHNVVYVSYADRHDDLICAHRTDNAVWLYEEANTCADSTSKICLALDSSDLPRIVHDTTAKDFPTDLNYSYRDEDGWKREILDRNINWGGSCSLALDDSDFPHITYVDNNNLIYIRWDGDEWISEIVDQNVSSSYRTSIGLDSSGNPHITYCDVVNYDLKYAWYGTPSVQLFVQTRAEGVLVHWGLRGYTSVSLRVLRSAGDGEPVEVSGALPGEATCWLDTKVDAGGEYCYWLETVDEDGVVSRFGPSEAVVFSGPAREISLSVYPSPASGAFTVDYTLPENGRISISLYDLSGRRVSTVFDGETAAGRQAFSVDAAALPPGVYLVYLDADAGTLTRRVVIAR